MNRNNPRNSPIALLTDFGYRDHYVGAMKGVINALAPGAPIIDITHGVPAQSIMAGALTLRESWRFFPRATIFVAVVDPGVGTSRKPVAITTKPGAIFVGPDNGLMWPAAEQAGISLAVELSNPRYRLREVSASFHGRDIFAPAAAHLRSGVPLDELGSRLADLTRLSFGSIKETTNALIAEVIHVDGFGNLVTNLERIRFEQFKSRFPTQTLFVTIAKSSPIKLHETYGHAPRGHPLAMFGSFGLMEVAVREGSAARRFRANLKTQVKLHVNRRKNEHE